MLKKIIMRENKNEENESKKLIEEFLIPEFQRIHEKDLDMDCLMIDFELQEEEKYVYKDLQGNQTETTEDILEQLEDIVYSYGIQMYKKTTGCIKYTFVKEISKENLL